MDGLSHLDGSGQARMVDVSSKEPTLRTAVARGAISVSREALQAAREGRAGKGDFEAVARVAGIMAAKRTPDLIPLCHPLRLDFVSIEIVETPGGFECTCTVSGVERTGFEMEALTGVSVALLTLYDMLKAADRSMCIEGVRLESKSGGRSDYRWQG